MEVPVFHHERLTKILLILSMYEDRCDDRIAIWESEFGSSFLASLLKERFSRRSNYTLKVYILLLLLCSYRTVKWLEYSGNRSLDLDAIAYRDCASGPELL